MMAAMMFPSVSPTVALYSRMTQGALGVPPLLFAAGYLAPGPGRRARVRDAAAGNRVTGNVLAWDRAGRWVAGATLVVAAVYELTPLKDVCLGKCRSPLGFLLGSWRDGHGCAAMGARHGAWCVGCCWALMASFFALGRHERRLDGGGRRCDRDREDVPSRLATYGTAAVLLALGVLLFAAPDASRPSRSPGPPDAADGRLMGS